jgi:hypothetical protein
VAESGLASQTVGRVVPLSPAGEKTCYLASPNKGSKLPTITAAADYASHSGVYEEEEDDDYRGKGKTGLSSCLLYVVLLSESRRSIIKMEEVKSHLLVNPATDSQNNTQKRGRCSISNTQKRKKKLIWRN